MSYPKTKDRYGLSGEDNQVGDTVYFGGNLGQIVGMDQNGMLTIKTGKVQQVVDPQKVPLWNERAAYQKLIATVGNNENPGDAYIRKDEMLGYIVGKAAQYQQEKYKNTELRSIPGWVERQIYEDIVNFLGGRNTNLLAQQAAEQ
jgi:hypothetical protein